MEVGGKLAGRRDVCAWVAMCGTELAMADVTVGLAAAIAALREELLAAMGEGENAAMKFRLAPVELSMQVAVSKDAGGKIGWHVIGLGGSYSSATTQTLALRLEPVWKQDDGSYTPDGTIADQSAQPPHFGPRTPETRPLARPQRLLGVGGGYGGELGRYPG